MFIVRGYRAVLVMPMCTGEDLVGAVSFGDTAERAWPADIIANLRLMSDVLANALARRQADEALRASEELKSGILDSVSSGVAVIDATGRLRDVNANWMHLVGDSQILPSAGWRSAATCSTTRRRRRGNAWLAWPAALVSVSPSNTFRTLEGSRAGGCSAPRA